MLNIHTDSLLTWLKDRVRKDKFNGLPLSILFLIFGYIAFHLAGLTEDVITSDWIVHLDYRLTSYFESIRYHPLVEFFLIFTFLGQPMLVAIGFILSVIGLLWMRLTIWIVPLLVSVVTSLLLIYAGKNIIARTRPEDPLFPMHSFSFPSGHSAIAVSLYGFVGLIFMLESKRKEHRFVFLTLTFSIVSLIFLSRLYLGVHYLSDVIGGILVGGLSVTLGFGVYVWQKLGNRDMGATNRQQYWKIIILGILFCLAWGGFEVFGEHSLYHDQLRSLGS
jgi:undecaprenyl-diphosphatase